MDNMQLSKTEGKELKSQEIAAETATLLHQCALCCKQATDSFSQLIPIITDEGLRLLVRRYGDLCEGCSEGCRRLLKEREKIREKNESEPRSSWLSSQVKLAFRSGTSTVAALLFDGCHAMIRDLYAALHRAPCADGESRRSVYRLIGTAEDFREELKDFL